MLKKVLWIALACAVILAALAISRGMNFTSDTPTTATAPVAAPAAEDVAQPAAAQPPPAPAQPTAPPVSTPEDLQVQEDAAAVGLTTVEPEAEEAPAEAPPN